jgi:hypothetical protein
MKLNLNENNKPIESNNVPNPMNPDVKPPQVSNTNTSSANIPNPYYKNSAGFEDQVMNGVIGKNGAKRVRTWMSLVALICGIVAIIFPGIGFTEETFVVGMLPRMVLSLVAIVFGILCLKNKYKFGLPGVILGGIALILTLVIILNADKVIFSDTGYSWSIGTEVDEDHDVDNSDISIPSTDIDALYDKSTAVDYIATVDTSMLESYGKEGTGYIKLPPIFVDYDTELDNENPNEANYIDLTQKYIIGLSTMPIADFNGVDLDNIPEDFTEQYFNSSIEYMFDTLDVSYEDTEVMIINGSLYNEAIDGNIYAVNYTVESENVNLTQIIFKGDGNNLYTLVSQSDAGERSIDGIKILDLLLTWSPTA